MDRWLEASEIVKRLGIPLDIERLSSHNSQVTSGGWILDRDGKRLLMSPSWQSSTVDEVRNGQFLALLHGGLSEPVILDLEP